MNILVIRRDNIGDLVCTTPLLTALRTAFPTAWIGVLANTYNAPILDGNPHIDEVFAYRKVKHREKGERRALVWSDTAKLIWKLRRKNLDIVLCASPGAKRFARFLGAKQIIEAKPGDGEQRHEVEITFRLLQALGVQSVPGPLVVCFNSEKQEALRRACALNENGGASTVAFHLSARKPSQRWPTQRFAELARRMVSERLATRILLFWAPGDANDPKHPGDDEKAIWIQEKLSGYPVLPIPTHTLPDLVAGLSLADAVICSDGGAMHIAAGLGKPIVCFFGNSDATRWHPWGVPYELLQKDSRDVADITVEEALDAFSRLLRQVRAESSRQEERRKCQSASQHDPFGAGASMR